MSQPERDHENECDYSPSSSAERLRISGDIPPLPHARLLRRAYLSTGAQLFYLEMANKLL